MTVEVLTTRVESQASVESPGNLPSIVRLDNMRFVHFSRNPIIAKFLKAHKFVREFGEGVDRMYRELKEAGNPTPKYEQIAFMIVGTAYSSMYEQVENPLVVAEKHPEYGTTKKNISKDLENPPVNLTDKETTEKDLENPIENPTNTPKNSFSSALSRLSLNKHKYLTARNPWHAFSKASISRLWKPLTTKRKSMIFVPRHWLSPKKCLISPCLPFAFTVHS